VSSIYDALKRSQTNRPLPPRTGGPEPEKDTRKIKVIIAAVLVGSALTLALVYGVSHRADRPGTTQAPAERGPVDQEKVAGLMNKADRLRLRDDTEGAMEAYREVITLSPGHVDAHMRLGELYYGAQRFDEALSVMDEARKMNPDEPRILNNMGSVLLAKGDPAKALTYFVQARKSSAEYVEPLYNMACAYARLNKKGAALSSLSQAAAMQPEVRLWASRDPDLASLRDDREFQAIVRPAE
jgi:tetratricopeptide (TPR) repeat protein